MCGNEEPVGPFLGELAGLAEHDRHVRPGDLQFCEPVGDHGGTDALELDPAFEHSVLCDQGAIDMRGIPLDVADLGYLGPGSSRLELRNIGDQPARVLLLGAPPLPSSW